MRNLLLVLAVVVSSVTFANPPALVSAARQQTRSAVVYDGTYTRIGYPMGDVPLNRGVCTDVVIRAYRAIGIDLQVLIHEDMSANFGLYPRLGSAAAGPGRNIYQAIWSPGCSREICLTSALCPISSRRIRAGH
jgi:uncharacterized protein YijF (DUF1287 family)